MASIVELRPTRLPWTDICPGKRADEATPASETLRKRYETLLHLSRSLAGGTVVDWIRDLTANLQSLLHFDFLDVVLYTEDGSEVLWRHRPTVPNAGGDIPIEEIQVWCVLLHQQPLQIA